MFPQEDFKKVIEIMLIDHKFEFPITFVMIGINGAFMVARFEMTGQKLKTIVLSGKAKNLKFPINTMFVDAKGKVAHISFERLGQHGDLTRWDGQPEMPPIGWPKA